MMTPRIWTAVGVLATMAGLTGMTQAQDPVAADFEATPSFTEDFGTAATPGYVGRWNFLPLLTTQSYFSSVSTPTILTATPGTLNANWVTNNPVAGSTSGAVLAMGNLASAAATTFGLNYWICDNSAADGSGTDFTTLTDYRAVARVYLPSVADAPGRFQVGLIAHSGATGTLFETSNFYNTSSTGIGPGFGARGVSGGTQAFPTTSALATSGWRLISIMIKGDRVAIGVDANGDNTIDESDPLEYQVYDRNTANPANGPFGFFTVGTVDGVTLDQRPLLIDWVSIYLPATPPPPPPPLSAENWSMYE